VGPNRIDIVAFGGDYNLYHWSTAQSGFDELVGGVTGVGTPTIVSAASNNLDIVFRNLNAAVTHVSWNGSSWGSESLGGLIRGLPSAAVTSGPTRRVYALGTDQLLYENAKPNGGFWSSWQSVSNAAGAGTTKLAGSPHAITQTSGVVMVQARIYSNNTLGPLHATKLMGLHDGGQHDAERIPHSITTGGAWAATLSSHGELWNGSSWSDKAGIVE